MSTPPLHCPECSTTLVEELHLGIHLDRCPECRGLWFDSGELDSYRMRVTGEGTLPMLKFARDMDQPSCPCPRCRQRTLVIGDLGEYPLHRCGNCRGVFVPSYSIDAFKPRSAGRIAGDIAVEGAAQVGFEGLGEILTWIVEGIFDGL